MPNVAKESFEEDEVDDMPSKTFPSDHVRIAAEFAVYYQDEKSNK